MASVVAPRTAHATDHLTLTGELSAHDPSSVIQAGNRFYYFSTGSGILSRSSGNLRNWVAGPSVFTTPPAWTKQAVPGFAGVFWAPDIVHENNKYFLYYAVSTFGSQTSAIGLATNSTLDPTSTAYKWVDQGAVIESHPGDPFNTIDPAIFHTTDGSLWMTFGSYWNGIYDTQLDPKTGTLLNPTAAPHHLASNSSIEASYMIYHLGYYYLFVDWGSCCQGVASTYNLRVGRSRSETGPFRDESGVDMASGGGSLFLAAEGRYVGPGHISIYSIGRQDYFTFHYYDRQRQGAPTFGDSYLFWTPSGWPTTQGVPVPEPSALGIMSGCAVCLVALLAARRTGIRQSWATASNGKRRDPAAEPASWSRNRSLMASPSQRFSSRFSASPK